MPAPSSHRTSPASVGYLLNLINDIFFDPSYFGITAALVIAGDAVLTQFVIRFISFTEIDWETYMQQVALYIKGERNYAHIEGSTGPLVYPAGHVHIHELLYRLTDTGKDLKMAQQIYGLLYIASLIFTCAVYQQAGGVPNWVLLLLPLSKRLHSIYVLRLFNDCWAATFAQGAVLAYGSNMDSLGTLLFSTALSVKMSAMLYAPGILVILFKRHGLLGTVRHLCILFITQLVFAQSFLLESTPAYLSRAFDLSRVFLYKWTVNWRFLSEDTFLRRDLAMGLLACHALVLVAFGIVKWCRADGGVASVLRRGLQRPAKSPALVPVTADDVTTILYTSNLIGILFARSLHYQFYSWYAQQLPFLAWRTRYPVPVKVALLLVVEYAWNVFPSTSLSSGVLLAAHILLLAGVWSGYPEGKIPQRSITESHSPASKKQM